MRFHSVVPLHINSYLSEKIVTCMDVNRKKTKKGIRSCKNNERPNLMMSCTNVRSSLKFYLTLKVSSRIAYQLLAVIAMTWHAHRLGVETSSQFLKAQIKIIFCSPQNKVLLIANKSSGARTSWFRLRTRFKL